MLVDGQATLNNVPPGPIKVSFHVGGIADNRQRRGTVPDTGTFDIFEILKNDLTYTPEVVSATVSAKQDAVRAAGNAKTSEELAEGHAEAAGNSANAASGYAQAAGSSANAASGYVQEVKDYANLVRAVEFRPESYGAVGDGVTDDAPAINQAIAAATQAGGGNVPLTKTYAVGSPLNGGGAMVALVHMYGVGDMAAKLIAKSNVAVIGGYWHQSIIENVFIDSAEKGSPCVAAHFDKVTFRNNLLTGWSNYGMFLNSSGDDIGLLNRIEGNHIVQGVGVGIWTTYRFVDSWIAGNNIGSTGPNLSLEAGPIRVTENHLNGTPDINIDLRGNQRVTITGNICEGARAEAIRYTMPSWLSVDEPQIQIVGNALSNGGKGTPNTKPAIGIYGVSSTKRVKGFNIVGNIMACQDEGSGWNYAVQATNAADVVAAGNQWELGYSVSAVNGDVTATGNTSGNKIPPVDIGASTATTANTVALRTSAGRLTAANPSGTTDVVNKGTMDTALADKAALATLNTRVPENLALRLDTTVGTRVFAGTTMIYGDTGWRDITSLLNPGWTGRVLIKRTTHHVVIRLQGILREEEAGDIMFTLPYGYIPDIQSWAPRWTAPTATSPVSFFRGQITSSGGFQLIGGMSNSFYGDVEMPCSLNWPTT